MKKMTFIFLMIAFFEIKAQENHYNNFITSADLFFNIYVQDGKVNYSLLIKNKKQLDFLLNSLANIKIDELDISKQKSFEINSYNLLVINQITENYPVNSPLEIKGFFDKTKFRISNTLLTLNELENNIREKYNDPRIHFVLVCAGLGCPPIINNAYQEKNLNEQINNQTIKAINDSNFIRINKNNKEVEISEIFKWYSKDFKSDSTSKIIDYLNLYRKEKIPAEYKLNYYSYDWSLNDISNSKNNTSNLVQYTPSALMQKGKFDVKLFNNLYTQKRFADENGKIFMNQPRANFFTSSLEVYYGISKNARINLGFITNLRSNVGNNENPFSVFSFSTKKENNIGLSRSDISNIGLSTKWMPFKKHSNFSVQSTFFFPIFKDLPNTYYLDKRSYIFENRFFYDKFFFSNKFQLFSEIDFTFHFGEKTSDASNNENSTERFANNSVATPLSCFISYFPSNDFSIYSFLQQYTLLPLIKNGPFQEFTQTGVGVKYQITSDINIELSSSRFFRGHNSGLGSTFNLGLRIIP